MVAAGATITVTTIEETTVAAFGTASAKLAIAMVPTAAAAPAITTSTAAKAETVGARWKQTQW